MTSMRIEMTDTGPVVAAEDLGPLLGLPAAEIPRLMRDGVLTAWHERGIDEDAGRFRLGFRYGARQVRLTCTGDGTIVSTVSISATEREVAPVGVENA